MIDRTIRHRFHEVSTLRALHAARSLRENGNELISIATRWQSIYYTNPRKYINLQYTNIYNIQIYNVVQNVYKLIVNSFIRVFSC